MRSISYILKGKPKNLDDCIDKLEKEQPLKVSLKLKTLKYKTDLYSINELYVVYKWKFPSCETSFEIKYGGCLSNETLKRQKKSVDNANYRLEKDLELLIGKRLYVKGSEKRFKYDAVYKKKK